MAGFLNSLYLKEMNYSNKVAGECKNGSYLACLMLKLVAEKVTIMSIYFSK